MSQSIPSLVTIADMARAFDLPEATLRRVLRKRGIGPTAKAGNIGVYDSDGVARARHAVNAYLAHRAEKAEASQ